MKVQKQRVFLSTCVYVLHLMNLWPKENQYVYSKWRFIKDISLIVSIMPCAIPILADFSLQLYDGITDLTAIIDNLIALTCIVEMIYMIICFINKRRLIKKLVTSICDFEKYGQSQELLQTDRKANLYSKMFLWYGILGNFVYMLMPQLNVKHCVENRSQQLIDQGIPCGLVVRCRFPFKFDYTPVFEIVFVHQIYTCSMVTLVVLVLTMLLCGFLMHLEHQLQHLKSYIERLDLVPCCQYIEQLHFCIKYHCAIIDYSSALNEAFSLMMLLHLSLTSIVISVLGFEVLSVDNLMDSVRFCLHLLGWLVLLLLICYYGQKLADESLSLAEKIYSLSWFTRSTNAKLQMKMMIMRSQKPLTLSAAGMGVMTLPTFLRVLSSAYSFLTLLLKIKS
ncbi:odorant receptor 49b-like [Aethina tumida]|uniref:odorant receptor 49b-like n=1 Tax=Aethina tumida TaxID=116153 RepID=UPI002147F5D5|nr:odorant receptor 49b-like [Aethina tumida]